LLAIIVVTALWHNMTLCAGQSIPPDDKQLQQMLLEQRNSRPTYQRIYDDIPDDVIIETDSGNPQPALTKQTTEGEQCCHATYAVVSPFF